jgi:lipoprotein-anchoring transpeptidase ErfK/SrfK
MPLRSRSLLLAGLLIVALLAGAAAVYAYDDSHKRQIAEGVRVNGVDVGGMSAGEARSALRAALLEPLDRPVVARYEGRRFTLTPEQASIGVDIDGSVSRALIRSRQGNMFSRTWREVRGEELDVDLDAKITWSRPAVRRLVARVQKALDRPAVDATVDLQSGVVDPKPSHAGLAVRGRRLQRDVERELLDAGARRRVRVRAEVVEPNVTTAQLREKYPAVLIVNRSAFRLTFYKNLKPAKTYGIAIGEAGRETPAGLYKIQNKAVDPAWTMPNSDWVAPADRGKVVPGGTPENPLKARWLGIYDGAGIHGTDAEDSIGTAASKGCIRMRIPEVKELYPQVPVGAPVFIS